jgi:hypothetical protein
MSSSGLVTSSTASSALRPSALMKMSTIGTLICGSSSRGSDVSAITPTSSDAIRMSGVSGDRMNAAVIDPEMPRFMA